MGFVLTGCSIPDKIEMKKKYGKSWGFILASK